MSMIFDCVQPSQCAIHASLNSLMWSINFFSSHLQTCWLFVYTFPVYNMHCVVKCINDLCLYATQPLSHPCITQFFNADHKFFFISFTNILAFFIHISSL